LRTAQRLEEFDAFTVRATPGASPIRVRRAEVSVVAAGIVREACGWWTGGAEIGSRAG
jgi:hypothetical protein